MAAMSFRRYLSDRLTIVQIIQRIFARSPVFRDALISGPHLGPEGEMIVEVSFDHGPTAFRVVAPSEEKAYAILHELASAMVEIERSHHRGNGHNHDDQETDLVGLAGYSVRRRRERQGEVSDARVAKSGASPDPEI
jgi:hypothetical protein